jgi:putative ATPase
MRKSNHQSSSDQPRLFENEPSAGPPQPREDAPLADRMRPATLDEFVGQEKLVGPDGPLRRAIVSGRCGSILLWGPPGTGKTTLARILCNRIGAAFESLSAVTSGKADLREVIERASRRKDKSVLFVDEIHRWNKAQQDALLPYVENGTILLVGATTENPSFEIISPLLSRCEVYTLMHLEPEAITSILERALEDKDKGLALEGLQIDDDVLPWLAASSFGDGRVALNRLERVVMAAQDEGGGSLSVEFCEKALAQRSLLYDKSGEEHYNLISALHKSLRGSSPDGAVYWLMRMLESGEDPLYVARRMVRFASEDVGLADPRAIMVATAAVEAYRFLGSPEGELALLEAAVYLACAPKSNSLEKLFMEMREEIERTGALPVPKHLRNAPTGLMKKEGYGKGYKYAHDHPNAITEQEYLPEQLKRRQWYEPTERGYEKTIQERLQYWKELLQKRQEPS